MKKYIFTFCLLICVCQAMHAQNKIPADIHKALKDSLVSLRISGVFGGRSVKDYSDLSGVHYGECMLFKAKNNTGSDLSIHVPAGLKLESEDPGIQNMFITKSFLLNLTPHEEAVFKTYAMCGEIHDQIPDEANFHTVGKVATGNVMKIIRQIEAYDQQNKIGQHALWAVTDNVSEGKLKHYGANTLTLANTLDLLKASGADCRMTRAERTKVIPMAEVIPDTVINIQRDTIIQTAKVGLPGQAKAVGFNNILMLLGGVIAGFAAGFLLKGKNVKVPGIDQ